MSIDFVLIGLYGPLFRPLVENKGLPYVGKAGGVLGPPCGGGTLVVGCVRSRLTFVYVLIS